MAAPFETKEIVGLNTVSNRPLVSVGIPTYNRPQKLEKALKAITKQSYENLEIIISDNASDNPAVGIILNHWLSKDKRIRVIRQEINTGAIENFSYVLEAACGDFFMWAADDDTRSEWFVERCLDVLLKRKDAVAVTAEVRYNANGVDLPFFPQGSAFYNWTQKSIRKRLAYVIRHGVDNLVYALFRRAAIVVDGKSLWRDSTHEQAINELPFLLRVAYAGEIVVIPEAGFLKTVSEETYRYIKWEYYGGKIPKYATTRSFRKIRNSFKYHQSVLNDIDRMLKIFKLDVVTGFLLRSLAAYIFYRHFIQMIIGRKWMKRLNPKNS